MSFFFFFKFSLQTALKIQTDSLTLVYFISNILVIALVSNSRQDIGIQHKHTWQRLVGFHAPYRDNEGVEAVTLALRVQLGQHNGVIRRLTHYRQTHEYIILNSSLSHKAGHRLTNCAAEYGKNWGCFPPHLEQPSFGEPVPSVTSESSSWLLGVEHAATVAAHQPQDSVC